MEVIKLQIGGNFLTYLYGLKGYLPAEGCLNVEGDRVSVVKRRFVMMPMERMKDIQVR